MTKNEQPTVLDFADSCLMQGIMYKKYFSGSQEDLDTLKIMMIANLKSKLLLSKENLCILFV